MKNKRAKKNQGLFFMVVSFLLFLCAFLEVEGTS